MQHIVIKQIDEHRIDMIWPSSVSMEDVRSAFSEITSILNTNHLPMFIIVDIRANPKFPVSTTLASAYYGPYRAANFREWLIIGTSTTARFIGATLNSITGKNLVCWFDDKDSAEKYLSDRMGEPAAITG